MILKLPNGMYRVRYDYGFGRRYHSLKKSKNLNSAGFAEIKYLEETYGLPKRLNTRRSMNCLHLWQAKEIDNRFKEANALEAQGKSVPPALLDIEIAPEKATYVEELGYFLASICGFHESLIKNADYELFLSQSDSNLDWIDEMEITKDLVWESAIEHCMTGNPVVLKDSTFIFMGSITGFTGHESYIRAVRKLALELKVDGIITTGSWVKSIFLHKVARKPNILPALRDLAESVKIYAIRSNRDNPEHLNELKAIGLTFINGIEDEKNIFTGLNPARSSTQDQLSRFENSYPGKNVFTFTTYVGIKSQGIKGGDLRYLVGSGSSGYNTPGARVWAGAYDSQLLNSGISDSIGGHLLRFDSEGNVYPTTFRFHTELDAILYGGKAYYATKTRAGKLHIILSDFHALSHHKYSLAALIGFLDKYSDQIETFVINGDFLDNLVLCHHNKGQLKTQMDIVRQDMDFLKEIAYTRQCLILLTAHLKKGIKRIFKMGNHEINSIDRFLQRDINHFLTSLLDIHQLLDLKNLEFEVIDTKSEYEIGDIVIHHGHEMERKQARRILGRNSVRGHSHGLNIDPLGMTLSGMEDPKKVHYPTHNNLDWSTGFAAITEVDGKTVIPQPILVRDNKFSDFDKLLRIEKIVEIELPKKIQIEYNIEWTGREPV